MPETWFPTSGAGVATSASVLERVASLRPAYAAALRDVEAAVWGQDQLEPELLELCRLRIAQMLQADEQVTEPPGRVVLDPVVLAQLRQWPTSDVFTERQRVCLGFAEQLLVDAQGVGDEQAASVIAAIGDSGFLVLTYACGFFETTQRASIVLGVQR